MLLTMLRLNVAFMEYMRSEYVYNFHSQIEGSETRISKLYVIRMNYRLKQPQKSSDDS